MTQQTIQLDGNDVGVIFDGIGIVNGGGATSVLLKDYPEPQCGQILDLVFEPKFGASVSALFVEIPGDGNATQGSMLSHQHTRDDLNYERDYLWWILSEARKGTPKLTLDGTVWSAPGWIGDGEFWSQDAADYYLSWLQGLRDVYDRRNAVGEARVNRARKQAACSIRQHVCTLRQASGAACLRARFTRASPTAFLLYGLEFAAIGCRNEKGVSIEFAKMLRKTLNDGGFESVRLHAFVDGKQVMSTTDALYLRGMVGLWAGANGEKLSMPYYGNLRIGGLGD